MKDFSNIADWTPKKLRTLRNNLNNRLMSFKDKGEDAKELSNSHMLKGLDEQGCKELLDIVKDLVAKK
ncbi:MAG: hypothetical protein BM556_12095 [Bacteriovorax sp. MedPE-SWde]|nr:MAG: hypothetical protein BM556_12095 [Bacteriovorax sp. MedPE-SWde]